MTHTTTRLSEDEFDAQYPLVANHLNPNGTWAFGDGPGCLFNSTVPFPEDADIEVAILFESDE